MKSEADPITDDEWLLRRVHKERFPTDVRELSPNAFEPRCKGRDPDVSGISLFREACLTHPDQMLSNVAADKLSEIGIVRVKVSELKRIGISIIPDPTEIPGHVLLPELNAQSLVDKADLVRPLMKNLAEHANQQPIARFPPSMKRSV